MTIKKLLLGSTALIGAGLLGSMVAPAGAGAAEVRPVGALDIQVGGFMRWYAFAGHIGGKTQRDNQNAGSYDFRNDTEIFVFATGKDEATGLDYGARVELEADGDSGPNGDETWAWIRGTFGEFRFGDEDGGSDLQKVGAYTFAAFSGGLDGVGPIGLDATVQGANSGDNTKIIYITPTIAGFNGIVSYTPRTGADANGRGIGGNTDDGNVDDLIEGGIAYRGTFGDVGLLASVIGHYGHFNNSGSGTSDTYKIYGGLNVSIAGINFGGGYGYGQGIGVRGGRAGVTGDNTGAASGDGIFERGTDYQWFNLGAGAKLGPANVSIGYGQVIDNNRQDDFTDNEPWQVVLGADVGIAPGLVVGGEIAYFDMDLSKGQRSRSDSGVLGLVGVRTAF
jgi:hypothetical protein